jgi:hypothetical protein
MDSMNKQTDMRSIPQKVTLLDCKSPDYAQGEES